MFLSPSQLISKLPLKKGDTVADFGCGSGAYLSSLSNAVGQDGRVYAFDINQDLLERLKREAEKYGYDNVDFAVMDVERGTLCGDYTCDAVVISNLLFQVSDIDAVIKEAKRVLKPNAFMLIVEWKDSFSHLGPHHDHVVAEEKLLAILAKNDITVKKHLPAGEFHYALIAEV